MSKPFPVPVIREGALSACTPHGAEAGIQQALGYPGELVEDWPQRAVTRLGELLEDNRALKVMLDSCTRCGACTDQCPYFLGSGDPLNMPVARQDLLRAVYRRHYTLAGRLFPNWVGAAELDEQRLDDWYRYFHQCSECRRCANACPHGIDTAEITMAGREILASIGRSSAYGAGIVEKAQRIGNNLGLKPHALAATLTELEEELEERWGVPVSLPLDDPSAEVLVVVPSADFYGEPHVEGLLGLVRVLQASDVRWTFSTRASEAANFALFGGNDEHLRRIAERISHTAEDLGCQHVLIGECGHAWRVAYSQFRTLIGSSVSALRIEHVCEFSYRLWREGVLHFDPAVHADKVLSFHDSCNVARASSMGSEWGGQFRLPRELLAACCDQVVEMQREATCANTLCCGGGGGLLTDELMPVREAGAAPRLHALSEVVDRHAVTHLVAICAICKAQFNEVLPDGVEVVGLHQLLGEALVLQPSSK